MGKSAEAVIKQFASQELHTKKKNENVKSDSYARNSPGVAGYEESTGRGNGRVEIELLSRAREVKKDMR